MSRQRPVSVSFEFFPPADEAMEKTLWESIRYLEPLSPTFVSVTYGADGSHARTHPQRGVARAEGDAAQLRAAPDLHRRQPRRSARHRAQVLGPGHPPHRRAARRRAGGHREVRTARRWLRLRRRPGRGPQDRGRFRDLRGRVSGEASRSAERRVRSRRAQAQDRRRRDARHHAVLLRHRFVPALPRCLRRAGHRRADRAGHPADHAFPAGHAFRQALRRIDSRLAGASLRRAGRQSRDAQADLRRGGHRAGAHAAAARRRPVPLLHAEPLRAHVRHLPCARRAARRQSSRKVPANEVQSRARDACASCSPNASSFSTAPWAP